MTAATTVVASVGERRSPAHPSPRPRPAAVSSPRLAVAPPPPARPPTRAAACPPARRTPAATAAAAPPPPKDSVRGPFEGVVNSAGRPEGRPCYRCFRSAIRLEDERGSARTAVSAALLFDVASCKGPLPIKGRSTCAAGLPTQHASARVTNPGRAGAPRSPWRGRQNATGSQDGHSALASVRADRCLSSTAVSDESVANRLPESASSSAGCQGCRKFLYPHVLRFQRALLSMTPVT
jgi:hypothetical protein